MKKKLDKLKEALKQLPEGALMAFEAEEKFGKIDLSKLKDTHYPSEMITALFHDYDLSMTNNYWYEIKCLLQAQEDDINGIAGKMFDLTEYQIKQVLEEIKYFHKTKKSKE